MKGGVFTSKLLKRLNIDLPIIQAPMAGVSTAEMAAAVSNAGALGSIGVGAVDHTAARKMIRATRALTKHSFNVNVFCHRPAIADSIREAAWIKRLNPLFDRFGAKAPNELREIYKSFVEDDEMFEMFLEERPKVVSFHFGVPSEEKIRALKEAGIVVLGSATNVQEASTLVRAGADAVIAQGYEAGGHRGVFDPKAPDDCLGTMALTRMLVKELDIPVIAAGGIMDGATILACLDLGASAALLGTAFIGCVESSADEFFRAALQSDAAKHTVMTKAISGRSARCIENLFTALGGEVCDSEIPQYPIAYDAGKALHTVAKAKGEGGYGAQWAGQGAPLARMSMPAGHLVALLKMELEDAKARRDK